MKASKKQLLALAVAIGVAVAGTSGAAIVEAPEAAEVARVLSSRFDLPTQPAVRIGRRVGRKLCGRRCANIGAR